VSDQIAAICGRLEALREELAQINPAHAWNYQRIRDRRRGIAILETQLDRIERSHQAFLTRRAELAARFHAFAANGGGRQPS
jgi:chromosome segregation ATPase